MEQRSGDGKAGHITEPAGVFRHFGAMGVTVEQRKQADDGDAGRDGKIDRKRDQQSQRHDRRQYARFDERQRHLQHAERVARQHDGDECERPCDNRLAALEGRP